MSLSQQVDQGLQNLEALLKSLDTSLGKNPKFSKFVEAVNDAEEKITSSSNDVLVKQALSSLDSQLDSIFGARDYIAEGSGEFNFNFNETLRTGFSKGLPNLQGDFYLDWSLTNSSQTSAGFKKVQLDVGSFFDDLIEPFFKPVSDILRPFDPIVKVLGTNIPGLDDFGIKINLLTLAGAYDRKIDTGLIDAIKSFQDITEAVESAQAASSGFIDLGEFSLSANGNIISSSASSNNPLKQQGLNEFIPKIKSLTGNRFSLPFLETPTTAFGLLIGKPDVKLIEYTIPGLEAGFEYTQKIPIPVPLPIPVIAKFTGGANFSSPGLTIGYDSFGIASNNLLNGFYLDGSKPVFDLTATLSAGISAGIEKIAYAEGDVDITGNVMFFLPNKNPQVRYTELENVFSSGNFTAEGSVKAGLTVYAEHITLNPIKGLLGVFTGDFDKLVEKYGPHKLAERDIFKFGDSSSGNGSTQFKPNLATYDIATRELRLNMGAESDRTKRNVNKEAIDEEFTVNPNLNVSAFGQQDSHSNVAKIVAFADTGNDKIIVSANVSAELHGGIGNDYLSGGDQGDFLYGDSNDDKLLGNKGGDELRGGDNADELYGGDGVDKLWGDNGNDVLNGGNQGDFLYGGEGRDILYGGDAGEVSEDGDDFLDGGAGNDLLIGEAGSDTIDGGSDIDVVAYLNSPKGVLVNIDVTTGYSHQSYFLDLEPSFSIAAGKAQDGYGTIDTLLNLEGILGSTFNDILIGNSQKNAIAGLAGNDLLIGSGGDDTLDGGEGIDTVSYRRSSNSSNIGVSVDLSQGTGFDGIDGLDTLRNIENIIGSQFADRLTGDSQSNTILGGNGKDIIDGKEGSDRLFGESGNDEIYGGSGDDYLVGGTGSGWPSDILDGGSGSDTASYITATSGVAASLMAKNGWRGDATGDKFISIENLEGSNYEDFLIGDDGHNVLTGLDGNDTLQGEGGNDQLFGGMGKDILRGGRGDDYLYGDDHNDTLEGGEGNDYLDGGTGNNILNAGEGNNSTFAANGNNTVYAGSGTDFITLGNGNNAVYAGEGRSSISLGNGNNKVYGGANADTIFVGNGNNEIYASEGENTITSGSGDDLIYSGSAADIIYAGAGNNRIYASEGKNIVVTQDGNDTVYAGSGRDFISTGGGDDLIYASEGDNLINGGTGNNTIYSGSGRDLFILNTGDGFDRIKNFEVGKDKLGLVEGLQLDQLAISQVNSGSVFFTQISLAESGDILARLDWTQANQLTGNSFMSNLPSSTSALLSMFG